MDVPIQFFQSIIAIELATTGALLFQVRYFEPPERAPDSARNLPDARLRLLVAVILGATIFGSLDAMVHGGTTTQATFVTIGLALSVLPILIRVLPPLVTPIGAGDRPAYSTVTISGLLAYAIAVAAVVVLFGR